MSNDLVTPSGDEKTDTPSLLDKTNSSLPTAEIHIIDITGDSRYHTFDVRDFDHVQRRLKERHVQMIAIAGTLGTGLFLGSGHALQAAGPLGALIAYALVGTTAYSSLCAVAEMACLAPVSGTFPHFAARWVDPALGFALGWNYFYTNAIGVPSEVTAAGILLTFWDTNKSHQTGYIAAITVCVCLINIFGVRWFGESEFIFAIIKLCLITILIITGLVIDLGGAPDHTRHGFQYWKNPGALAGAGLEPNHVGLDRFLGILTVLVQAAFSFQGMEMLAIAASETESPRRNIAKAVRKVFWRILIFYLLGVFVTGLVVPYNDPRLLSTTGNAADSPYVIAMTRAGIQVLPHIVNAGIFTSAFSAANTILFSSSRVLYGLALRGQAPKVLAYCTEGGLPIAAVLFSSCFAFLSFMSVSSSSETVFIWLQNLSTVGGFLTWLSINITYLFFYRGLKAQGIDRKEFIYRSSLQPWLAIWGTVSVTTFTLVNGIAVFGTVSVTTFTLVNGIAVFWHFNASGFLTAYINLPLFLALYVFWKLLKRTVLWKPHEMDFVTGIPTIEETEIPEVAPRTLAEKIAAIVF